VQHPDTATESKTDLTFACRLCQPRHCNSNQCLFGRLFFGRLLALELPSTVRTVSMNSIDVGAWSVLRRQTKRTVMLPKCDDRLRS
jgi:hypothetical protein